MLCQDGRDHLSLGFESYAKSKIEFLLMIMIIKGKMYYYTIYLEVIPLGCFFLLHQLFKLYSICFVLACKMPYGTLKITSSLLVCTYIYMLVWSSEVPSFASPDDVTLGQSGPFYLEFNEVLDICVITCYIIIMQQYLLKSEDFNE